MSQFPEDENIGGPRNVGLLAIQLPVAAACHRIFHCIQSLYIYIYIYIYIYKILRSVHTVYLCFNGSKNKQRSFPYTALLRGTNWSFKYTGKS